MENLNILGNKFFELPKNINGTDIITFLETNFKEYFNLIDLLTGDLGAKIQEERQNLVILCDQIINSLKCYLNGSPAKAYNELGIGISAINKYSYLSNFKNVNIGDKKENYFRVRKNDTKIKDRNELFHVPFDKRHLIKSYRYSISGIPCLYLANSIYLCWEELNKPDLDNLYFSRFQFQSNELKLMNLTFTPNQFVLIYKAANIDKEINFNDDKFFIYGLVIWPLSLSCSLFSNNSDSSFVKEYIIPQLTLEWITNEFGFDGIKYFSTKIKYPNEELVAPFINIAIPAKALKSGGHCDKLINLIELTEPKNISDFENLIEKYENNDNITDFSNWTEMCSESFLQEIIRQRKILNFSLSTFSKLEIELCNLETKKIQNTYT
jgi:hypothetical protein